MFVDNFIVRIYYVYLFITFIYYIYLLYLFITFIYYIYLLHLFIIFIYFVGSNGSWNEVAGNLWKWGIILIHWNEITLNVIL